MNARRDNEGGPPPPPLPPPPPVSMPGMGAMNMAQYATPSHEPAETSQPPNPLQQLLYQQQNEAQQFLRQFLSTSQSQGPRTSMAMASVSAPPPLPPQPPSSASIQLMTPIQPATYQSRAMTPPLPQSLQAPLPSPFPSATTSLARSDNGSRSSSPQHVGPPPGTRIVGDTFEYRAGETTASDQLEVTPVTIYPSQRHNPLGNMIAVNEHFISYPIRKGLIRLLSQDSGDRLLLREHADHTIADAAFFGPRSEFYLTAGTDNKVVIYRIVNDPLSHEVLKVVRTAAQRVIWHPFDSNQIAVVNGGVVFVVNLSLVTTDADVTTDMTRVSIRCTQGTDVSSQINDVVFSPCGQYLVTGGMDGFVSIYNLGEGAVGGDSELLHRFEPFEGSEVGSVRFVPNTTGGSMLLIGGDSNTKLSLWITPLVENMQPTCVQTVKIMNDADEPLSSDVTCDVLFDPSAQFLFVMDRARPTLFVLHLTTPRNDHSARRFDNITEFNVTYPILSATVLSRPGRELSMQLFTVQSQAIQRYNVGASRCYIPSGSELDNNQSPRSVLSHREEVGQQSVGAVTTEGNSDETSYQTPAESPRASTAASETEVSLHGQQNGNDEREYGAARSNGRSPPESPRRAGSGWSTPQIATGQEDSASLAGEDAIGSLRSYARSSPSSSVRAVRDDTSLLGEQSIDESIGGSDHIMAFLRRMEMNQMQREERSREAMQKAMSVLGSQITAQSAAQVERTIQKQIQTILVPAMGRIVLHTMENNFMKPVQAGFERVISERLVPDMEAKINSSLESTLPDQMEIGISDMVQRVVDDVRQPVRESFRECFRDIIIPSFQAATQKMFEQIHEHVLKGAASSATTGHQGSNADISDQLHRLIGAVDGLSKRVDQMGHGSVNGHMPTEDTMTPEERQFAAHKARVLEYLGAKDYEEAFKYALGAQDVNLVAFTCQQCDPRDVVSARPPLLSQMIILCLVQQLGANLSTEPSFKLAWLREALLVMNPRDESIAGFVASVLQELQSSLNLVPHADRDSQYTLVHHILNSLLSST